MNVKAKLGGFPQMEHDEKKVKDVSWEFNQEKYITHNVPVHIYKEFFSEEVYESRVSLKLFLLKDLMETKEIPPEIDYQESLDITLS